MKSGKEIKEMLKQITLNQELIMKHLNVVSREIKPAKEEKKKKQKEIKKIIKKNLVKKAK